MRVALETLYPITAAHFAPMPFHASRIGLRPCAMLWVRLMRTLNSCFGARLRYCSPRAMRIVRYVKGGTVGYGCQTCGGTIVAIDGDPLAGRPHAAPCSLTRQGAPSSVLCIDLNYRRHGAESGVTAPTIPVLFMKMPSSALRPGGPFVLPRPLRGDEVEYDFDLAVVIGRRCCNVSRDQALDYVLGYTGNDISARDWQMQWDGASGAAGKTFDTFVSCGARSRRQ